MKKILTYCILAFLMVECINKQHAISPTYNNGGYEFVENNSNSILQEDSVSISGKIIPLNGFEKGFFGTVQLGCVKVSSINGEYSMKVKPFNIGFQLSANSLGYLEVETHPFKTSAGDSIIVNFYLDEDKRMLINCEGN